MDGPYSAVVPTLADSNASGTHPALFLVRATTATPAVYFDSAPVAGYSVDNLAPAVPAPFAATYSAGASRLHWNPSAAADFAYFKLYRGATSGFTPSPATLIAASIDTSYADPGTPGAYFKLSAVDVNGNESGYATAQSPGTTGVAGGGAVVFALAGVTPNPATSGRLSVAFALPDGAPATLELLDVAGRRVASREVGALGAGRHIVELAPAGRQAPGLYLVRLTQGGRIATRRVTVLE